MELVFFPRGIRRSNSGWQGGWQVPSLPKLFHLPWNVLGSLFVLFLPFSMLGWNSGPFTCQMCVTTELHQSTKLADLLNNLPKATELVWNWNLNLGLEWFWNPAVCDTIWPFIFVWVQLPFWSFFGRTVYPSKCFEKQRKQNSSL